MGARRISIPSAWSAARGRVSAGLIAPQSFMGDPRVLREGAHRRVPRQLEHVPQHPFPQRRIRSQDRSAPHPPTAHPGWRRQHPHPTHQDPTRAIAHSFPSCPRVNGTSRQDDSQVVAHCESLCAAAPVAASGAPRPSIPETTSATRSSSTEPDARISLPPACAQQIFGPTRWAAVRFGLDELSTAVATFGASSAAVSSSHRRRRSRRRSAGYRRWKMPAPSR